MNPKTPPEADRVALLLVLPGGLGDLVQARALLEDVTRRADGPVDLLVGDSLAQFALGWGVFRAVLPLRMDVFYHGSVGARAALLFRLVRQIQERHYAGCLLFKAHPLYAIIVWAARVPRRTGLSRGWWGRTLLTDSVPLRGDVHRLDRLREVAALATGGELDPPVSRHRARHHRGPYPRIGIAAGGARNVKEEMPSRRWPLASYVTLATTLSRQWPEATFELFGGTGDAHECDQLMLALPPGRVVNRCGALRTEELEGAIAELDLMITHDSGLLHVAGRTDCGLVGIFGPTDPAVVAPRGEGVRTLWNPGGSTACHDEVFGIVNCPHVPPCIERVSVDDVMQAIAELMDEPRARTET